MPKTATDFEREITQALSTFAFGEVKKLCEELIEELPKLKPFPDRAAKNILNGLRRKRRFPLLERVASAFIKNEQRSAKVRLLHVQSLLDQSQLADALTELNELVGTLKGDDLEEVHGLIGRAHKQRYVDRPGAPGASESLEKAIRVYWSRYEQNRELIWHGINVVALVARAHRDKIKIPPDLPTAEAVAEEILQKISEREADQKLDLWGYATAMEATIALPKDKRKDLFVWAQRYVAADQADAFEFASSARQLREVWQLDESPEPELARVLLPLLHARQLQREGGEMVIDDKVSNAQLIGGRVTYEAYLSDKQSMQAFEWLMRAIARGRMVARIDSNTGERVGTGSLIQGSDLSPKLNGPLLLTNAHVLGDPKPAKGVDSAHAQVTFTRLDGAKEPFSIKKIHFRDETLDVCIAELAPGLPEKIGYPVIGSCAELRSEEPSRSRIYVVGHPESESLKYSLYDNYLVKFSKFENFLFYRSPTEGGSSGSPLFDAAWDLIGLHHSYDSGVPANRGTQIDRIREIL